MANRASWKTVAIGSAVIGGIGAILLTSRKAAASSLPSSTVRRVALIGDSYAVGLGPELRKYFPEFKYEGVVGTNTAQWASHSKACGTCGDWLTTFKPDVVLVSLGVNDGTAPNARNYNDIVSALHGIGARVVWIEPPAAVNTPAVRSTIASLGVSTVSAPTLVMANALHPASYNRWAQEIAQAVLQ
jgi:lysophospholipase L1-like esterase